MNFPSTSIELLSTTTIPPKILSEFQHDFHWTIFVAFFLAFTLGFSNGANDIANTMGTSIGSKVLKYWQAYLLATTFEVTGAVLVGYDITETLRQGIIDIPDFEGAPKELLLGQLAILGSTSLFIFIATLFGLPVAGSHSIIGATVGFSTLMRGTKGIHWWKILEIFISWLVSPILSGLTSVILYIVLDFAVLRRKHPLKCGLRTLPIFYFVCFGFITFAVVFHASKALDLKTLPLWVDLLISFSVGIITAIIFLLIVKPKLKQWVLEKEASIRARIYYSESQEEVHITPIIKRHKYEEKPKPPIPYYTQPKFEWGIKSIVSWFLPARDRNEDHEAEHMFSALEIFSGCLASFAHGAKETANVIASVTVLLTIYHTMDVKQNEPVPLYMFFFGSIALSSGFWILGYKTIRTVGKRMVIIDPCSGFTIQFGMAITAILASKAGLPISTTQCIVGSVVAVGTYKSGQGIEWKIFWSTVLAWVVTLPISGVLAAIIMIILKYLFL